jgi:hypothetical protein
VEKWKKILLDQGYTEDEINQAYNTVSQQAGGLGLSMSQVDPRYFASQATGQPYINDDTIAKLRQLSPVRQPMAVAAPTPSFAEALKRAKAQINPLFDVESQNRIQSATNNMLSRGVYGQPFSGRVVAQHLAPLEAQRNAQIAQVAQSIVDSAQQRALQERQLGFNEWQAKQMLDLQRGQFAHTKEQAEFDRFVQALQLASGRRAEDFERERFDYEKQYKDAQLALERQRLAAANAPTPVPPRTPEQQYKDSIYGKLMSGQPLTADERAIIGLQGDQNDLLYQATKLAQSDIKWTIADTVERQALVQWYIDILLGRTPAQPTVDDDIRSEGWLKE